MEEEEEQERVRRYILGPLKPPIGPEVQNELASAPEQAAVLTPYRLEPIIKAERPARESAVDQAAA